jgi:hypothetical protein
MNAMITVKPIAQLPIDLNCRMQDCADIDLFVRQRETLGVSGTVYHDAKNKLVFIPIAE